RSALGNSYDAIAFASPNDQQTIMFGAVGESMNLVGFGAALVGGLFLSLALSSLVLASANGAHRVAFAVFGVGAGAIGLSQSAFAIATTRLLTGFKAISFASAADQFALLDDAKSGWATFRELSVLALSGVLLAIVLAVVLLRRQVPSFAAVVSALLVSVVGVSGASALAKPAEPHLAMMERPIAGPPLRTFDTTLIDLKDGVLTLTSSGFVRDDGAPATDLASAIERVTYGSKIVNVGLGKDLDGKQLIAGLRRLRDQKVEAVRLVGETSIPSMLGRGAPRPFAVSRRAFAGVVMLLADDRPCDDCVFAFADTTGLRIKTQSIPRDPNGKASAQTNAEQTPENTIHLKWEGLALEQVMNSAWLAARDGRYLALHF
ncbi:MAG: hypothetical protein ACO1OB_23515, partial [Archangium sp.]